MNASANANALATYEPTLKKYTPTDGIGINASC